MDEPDVLESCLRRLGSGLDPGERRRLEDWWRERREAAVPLTEALLGKSESEWTDEILAHRAHRHPWYEQLARDVSLESYAAFLLENRAFPAFLPLVERALEVQVTSDGRAAVQRNIDDEQVPVPHTELMRRLIGAIKARVADLHLESYPSLVDRTLVFYYGYYCDPWHLIGALYATEAMAHHRMTRMGEGLRRLGFQPAETEFIAVHLDCDDGHARDWSHGVVQPSIAADPRLRTPIAQGIATCLETSARYLDDLCARERQSSRAARVAAGGRR